MKKTPELLKNNRYPLYQILFFIGTLLASVLGGYLPGILVGYLNNIINMQGNPGNVYLTSPASLLMKNLR